MFVFWWPLLRRISPSLKACPFFCYSRTFVPVNTTESWARWHFRTSAQLSFGVPKYFIVLCTKCIISNDLTGRSCLSVHVSFPSKFNECQRGAVMNVCSKSSGGDATEHRQKYLGRTERTNQEDGDNYTSSNFVIYYHGNTIGCAMSAWSVTWLDEKCVQNICQQTEKKKLSQTQRKR